jgi:hypothetical protein
MHETNTIQNEQSNTIVAIAAARTAIVARKCSQRITDLFSTHCLQVLFPAEVAVEFNEKIQPIESLLSPKFTSARGNHHRWKIQLKIRT